MLLLAPGRDRRRRRRADHARPASSGWPGRCSRAGLAHTVLAVPIAQERATMHLDTVCTMVDVDKIVMYPNVADTLTAYAVTVAEPDDGDLTLDVADAEPFLRRRRQGDGHRHAAPDRHRPRPGHRRARAVGRRQQHPGDLAPRVAVAYERNIETNARLEEAGIEVVADRRLRARLRPRRPALHVLPGAARPALSRARRSSRSVARRASSPRWPVGMPA